MEKEIEKQRHSEKGDSEETEQVESRRMSPERTRGDERHKEGRKEFSREH